MGTFPIKFGYFKSEKYFTIVAVEQLLSSLQVVCINIIKVYT